MKWAYSIQQKFKVAMLLAAVCAIVLITNLFGRYQMGELGESFSSIINDRLVVESYIYMIADHLNQKKLTFNTFDASSSSDVCTKVDIHNEAIQRLLDLYDKTFLTADESRYLEDFKNNVASLEKLEQSYIQSIFNAEQNTTSLSLLNQHFVLASENLNRLSEIQIKEGKILNDHSQHIVNNSSLLTSFEMVMLVCIAIILQIIVLASRPIVSRNWQESILN